VIRFSAFLVVAAVGTLIAGVVTSKLLLVYIAIGVSGLALLALGAGAVVHWRELTGKPEVAAAGAQAPAPSPPPAVVPPQVTVPEPAVAQVASAATGTAPSRPAWSGASPASPASSSRPGYLPTEPPPATRPPAPSEWKWRDDPAPRRDDPAPREAAADKPAASFTARGDSGSAVAADPPSVPADDLSVQDQTMIFRQPDQTMIFRVQPAADPEKPAASTPPASTPPASIAEPEPSPAEPAPAADAPAADAPAADSTAAEDTAAAADNDAADNDAADTDAESATPASAAEPAAGTSASAGSEPAPPADDTEPADEPAPPADEPEPADDVTTITKAAAPASDADPASGLEVTVVPGVPRYHKASCILIRFMGDSDLDKMTVAGAREAGCTPCRACLPDQSEESPELSGAPEPEPQA
jgi:hypothetical protein